MRLACFVGASASNASSAGGIDTTDYTLAPADAPACEPDERNPVSLKERIDAITAKLRQRQAGPCRCTGEVYVTFDANGKPVCDACRGRLNPQPRSVSPPRGTEPTDPGPEEQGHE